jgi:hypothetical protein
MRTPILFTVALALTACAKAEPPTAAPKPAPEATAEGVHAATAAPKVPLSQKTFGASITEKTSTPLTSLVEQPTKYADKTVRTEGVVTAVCKSMGCWMEIGDDTGQVHVNMAGHSFFVPKTASGHRAIVQGKLLAPDQDMACSDGCREHDHAGEPGQLAKVSFEATGVEFVD